MPMNATGILLSEPTSE
jgi:hypothetical protein